jgi:hypothetical protein
VWGGRLMLLDTLAGAVLLCFQVGWGALFLVPPVAWFAHAVRRTVRWRTRALDGLEARAATMTHEERERDLADLLHEYGGKPFPKVKRRVEAIRAIPSRPE